MSGPHLSCRPGGVSGRLVQHAGRLACFRRQSPFGAAWQPTRRLDFGATAGEADLVSPNPSRITA